MTPLSSRCISYFDCLRFVLAQVVVVGHGFGFFFGYWNGFFPSKAPYIQSIAVVGFFFVSGFLICRSVIANIKYNNATLLSYLVDRFSRIYITLIPCLLFVFLIDYYFSQQFSNFELSSNLTFETLIKNFLLIPSVPYGTLRPIWSLMFEWWIYILFGGLVFFRKNLIFSGVCIGLGAYYTFKYNARGEAGHLEIIWMTGAIAAASFDRIRQYEYSRCLACISLLIATFIYLLTCDAYNIFAGLFFSCGLLFIGVSFNRDDLIVPPRISEYLNKLAGYSFTLFLTHYTVLYWLEKHSFSGMQGFIVAFFLANTVAYLIASVTEKHHKTISRKILVIIRK